jgi:hypothetical protein
MVRIRAFWGVGSSRTTAYPSPMPIAAPRKNRHAFIVVSRFIRWIAYMG